MKNDKHEQNELQRMMEGRAARMIAAAVTVFLCVLTLFEFVALKMEWNVPALAGAKRRQPDCGPGSTSGKNW